MPSQRTPAAARFGGAITRRRAALLRQSGVDGDGGGVCGKDLDVRRVVVTSAPASLDTLSPDRAAATEPGPGESTPSDSDTVRAAVVEEPERKRVLPRCKLVRNPGSFAYRRLLPFLNEIAQNDDSNSKDVPSENAAANSAKELKRSRISSFDESAGGGCQESDPPESAEAMVVKTREGPEMNGGCGIVREETNTFPDDPAGSKPWLTRCTRSRFVHHQSSFSYKRMLPFLMENEISSREGERVKIRRVAEDMQLAPDGNDVSASGNDHLAVSEDSFNEYKSAQIGNIEEEMPSNADGNHVLGNQPLRSAVLKASSPECNSPEVQNVIQEEDSILNQDPLTSCEGKSISGGIDVLAGGQHLLPVSEDSPEEYCRDVAKTIVQSRALESYQSSVLEPVFSEASPLQDSTSEVQKATEEQPLTSVGDERNTLTLVKGKFLAKEKPQLGDVKELLTAQVGDTAEFPQVLQCQGSDLGCANVGFGSPAKTMIPSLNRCSSSQEHQGDVASLDALMICRPSDTCAVDICLSVEEMSGSVSRAELGSSKAGIQCPSGALSFGKHGPCPMKLSPKRGILKRRTRGCKGICMCLDCSTYRLCADRAFEFSRKQMHEADDIIGNLLKEMENLRSLVQNPVVQRESIQTACQRAFQVEEVARDRCSQMFVDLNSHCRIPGPRVRFAQYVEEKQLRSSPGSSSKHVEDKMGSSSRSSFSKRRCLKS